MSQDFRSPGWTRRRVLGMLGLGAAAAALPEFASIASAATPVVFPKGAVIRTLLKDYAPEDLAGGATLFHEHISFADDWMIRWNKKAQETRAANAPPGSAAAGAQGAGNGAGGGAAPAAPGGLFFMQDLPLMTSEMNIAKSEGIGCIVDAGDPDMGRDINMLRQLSMRSGMPIVLGGGYYTEPFYPKTISTMSEEQVVQALIKQTETDPIGVFGEIGSWDDISADERKVFRAVGKAHLATNLSVFTHTGIPGKSALEQLDILEDAGVKPNRIVIGHLGNLVDTNVAVQKAICKRGAFIGFDRQGGPNDGPQVQMAMTLIEAGYTDNLMFSADISNAAAMKKNGGQGYAKTLTVFVPKIKAAGATDEVLRSIMVDNPRRFLAFVPRKPRPKTPA
jgi:phosphotriesterase-related protein